MSGKETVGAGAPAPVDARHGARSTRGPFAAKGLCFLSFHVESGRLGYLHTILDNGKEISRVFVYGSCKGKPCPVIR
jgi:hypothetical protein